MTRQFILRSSYRLCPTGLFLLLASGCASLAPFDAGFIASRDTDLRGNERARAIGPLWEDRQTSSNLNFKAARPFFSTTRSAARRRMDILWPVGTFNTSRGERSWRVLNIIGHDFDVTNSTSRYRLTALPLFSMGRNANGSRYAALFPLGGRVNEFMGQDASSFVLFPLYARTARDDVESLHIMWPIYARTKGDNVARHRIFPLYGTSRATGKWRKRFVLWPFWTDVQYDDPKDPGSGFLFFPLYGAVKTEQQSSWTVLPPLFRSTRTPSRLEVQAPWPFIRYSRGDVDKLYVWPIWGTRKQGALQRSFLFWPIGHSTTVERPDEVRRTRMLLPILYTQRAQARGGESDGKITERYFKLWPLFTYRRVGNACMVRSLSLSPFKHAAPLERNYAPIWTLYSYERKAQASEHELLWGLLRKRQDKAGKQFSIFPIWSYAASTKAAPGRSWSVLKGLIGYKREGMKKWYRVLYFLRFESDTKDDSEL